MISLLHADAPVRKAAAPPKPAPAPPAPVATENAPAEFEPEFEIVMGRRQIASVALLVVVALAVFSGVSYLVGRSLGPRPVAPPVQAAVQPVPAPPPVTAPAPAPAPVAAPAPEPKPLAAPVAQASTGPLFADPVQGAVYIQVGAVEKGVAAVWAEGLRTHGLDAFVGPGPNDKIFRVLVGPLPNPDSYTHAKQILDSIGLNTFGKRYQQ